MAHDHFGTQCDFRRVVDEIAGFSDFDLHQVCLEYPDYLSDLQLSAETLYDAPKMQLLRTLVPDLVVSCLLILGSYIDRVLKIYNMYIYYSDLLFMYVMLYMYVVCCVCALFQSKGHRILIFSQWTRLLDLLEVLMVDLGLLYQRLDGSTPVRERQLMIDAFNASTKRVSGTISATSQNDDEGEKGGENGGGEEIKVFLLSTKAGGANNKNNNIKAGYFVCILSVCG